MSTRSRRQNKAHLALDVMLTEAERSVVANIEKRLSDQEYETSLDTLDLFHSLPASEQGWGKEGVDYE